MISVIRGRFGPQDDRQKSADTSRTQLNVGLSTELLKEAKTHARKTGLTLTEFVTTLLTEAVATEKRGTLSDRLYEIEGKHQRLVAYQVSSNTAKSIKGKIWKLSDKGAQEYSEVAIQEFERHALIYKLSSEQALEQIRELAYKYGSEEAEIIINILSRKVVANADHMGCVVNATGSCPILRILQEWSGEPLQILGHAFVNALDV